MVNVIGITGAKGAGKDTAARLIMDELMNSKEDIDFPPPILAIHSMATPLKKGAAELTGLNEDLFYNPDRKDEEIYLGGWSTPRRILQTLGTEWPELAGTPDIWIYLMDDLLYGLTDHQGTIIIPDIRRAAEANLVRKYNGTILRVNREDVPYTHEHETERPLPTKYIDYELNNVPGDSSWLRDRIVSILPAITETPEA